MEILTVRDLSFTYPGEAAPALSHVSFGVARGDLLAVCGETGSGKSTLLRMLKRELTPLGETSGRVLFCGRPLEELSPAESASKIGFVMQRPEQQIVTDVVWHELAFGLENLGVPNAVIRRRVAEMASYFGIEDWFDRRTAELSGGQKQLLNLAAVMVMQPEVLILDEPTAQLDPIAASDFIATVQKLNRELSLTVIMAEHRLEELVCASDRLLALAGGRVLTCGETRRAVAEAAPSAALSRAMPAAVRLWQAVGRPEEPCPLDVREGRRFVEETFSNGERTLPPEPPRPAGEPALEFRDVWFRYERDGRDVLRGTSLTAEKGEIFAILGGNGSGKSTALLAASGILRPYAGEIRVLGKKLAAYRGRSLHDGCVAMLPQDVQTLFLANTVAGELADAGCDPAALPFDLSPVLDRHPYDLSGGQQQLLGLAKVLASRPRVLLLDEPTKGLDAGVKAEIAALLRRLRDGGTAVVLVTHDVEFAAGAADRCAMFFRGEITSAGSPRTFFAGNSFYTTAADRMTRGFFDGAVTVEDAAALCRKNGRKSG